MLKGDFRTPASDIREPFVDVEDLADIAVAAMIDQLSLEWITPEVAREIRGHAPIVAWLARVHERAPSAAG